MRLDVVCSDPSGPVARHRVHALLPALAAAGFTDVRRHALPRRLHGRFGLFRELRGSDLVLLLRKLFTRAELTVLRRSARRLVYDLDDAIMYRDPSRSRPRSHRRARQFRAAARTADLVTAGNEYLLAHARDAAPETPVVLAPTPVDTRRYVPQQRRRRAAGDPFRVGWIGSRSTRPYLRMLDGVLARLAVESPGITLAVMADAPPPAPAGLQVDFEPWSEEAEVPFLQSLDAGVMPLTDDLWSRGKCGFKLLQYMACGVPAVTSPVGVNVEIVAAGDAGLLADGPDAWITALASLARAPAQARDLGARGRARVEALYSAHVLGPRFARALAECARDGAS